MNSKEKIKIELNNLTVYAIEILLFHTDLEIEGHNVQMPKFMESLGLCYNKWYSTLSQLITASIEQQKLMTLAYIY